MSDNKHTEEFKRIMTEGSNQYTEPSHVEANNFVLRLSESLSNEIVGKIVAQTGKTYVTNIQIYKYCKKNNIQPDYDPYLNEQKEINFEPKKEVDLSTLKELDDVEYKGRTGIVMSNDTENKSIIIEFDDTDEMETISYGKK
jgi:ribosomal protein L21E